MHKKIVSFMAPYADSNWTEEATQELFSSLFGNYEKFLKKGDNVNIADDDEDEVDEVDEPEVVEDSEMKIL